MDGEMTGSAIVAGGGGAIGRATARRLADRGARVAVIDRDAEGLAATVQACGPERCTGHVLDLTDPAAVQAAVDAVVEHLGAPGLVVSGVGALGPHGPTAWELGAEDWSSVMAINLLGPVNLVRATMPHLQRAGRPARIALITSLMAMLPDGRLAAYTAAKHALVSYAESLELQLRDRRLPIEVTIICPGPVATAMNARFREDTGIGTPPEWPSADEVAEQLVTALDGSEHYVFTHPGSAEKLQAYYEEVLAAARGETEPRPIVPGRR